MHETTCTIFQFDRPCDFFSFFSPTPSSIEAVEYDPASNRWYVSNGSQTMLVTSDAGQSWDYFGAAHATHGMEVVGDYLYAINSNLLACYDLASATQLALKQ